MYKFDIVIVGAGIVGLATAIQIMSERPNTKMLVIDKEKSPAKHQTSHNSGVIHSGLYYAPNSLKAKNCIDGYHQLIKFCREEGVSYEICGKIVVAVSDDDLPRLEELKNRGQANGLKGIRVLNPKQIQEIEPHCTGLKGLFVPQTGIVDFSQVAKRMVDKLSSVGVEFAFNQKVEKIQNTHSGITIASSDLSWTAKTVVTCAGLQSDRLARMTVPDLDLRIVPFRGEYYKLKKDARYLVKKLIYPVPDPAFPFLGVHFTRMINNNVECGPNAIFSFGREAYSKGNFNLYDTMGSITWPGFRKIARKYWRNGLEEYYRSVSKKAFLKALQRLIPDIKKDQLEPGGAGIRAQACSHDGQLLSDFSIKQGPNFLHVCNAPSPAATASLAIGKSIAEKVFKEL